MKDSSSSQQLASSSSESEEGNLSSSKLLEMILPDFHFLIHINLSHLFEIMIFLLDKIPILGSFVAYLFIKHQILNNSVTDEICSIQDKFSFHKR